MLKFEVEIPQMKRREVIAKLFELCVERIALLEKQHDLLSKSQQNEPASIAKAYKIGYVEIRDAIIRLEGLRTKK
jgi:hypothetical protein